MPPRAKFTKEHIAQVAFDLVRQDGMNALTARNLGKHLGSSYCPIFTLFENMQEVQNAVLAKANALYNSYVAEGLNQEVAFIGVGKQFIKFAMDEPQLFQIMFIQRDCVIDFEQYISRHKRELPPCDEIAYTTLRFNGRTSRTRLPTFGNLHPRYRDALFTQGLHVYRRTSRQLVYRSIPQFVEGN